MERLVNKSGLYTGWIDQLDGTQQPKHMAAAL